MSQATVDHILDEIRSLSDEERDIFRDRLSQLEEAEWQAEAEKARAAAEEAGVDDEDVRRRIERLRYG